LPSSLQTHVSFGSLQPPCYCRRSPACPAIHTSSCTQISPAFTQAAETLFSIIVKQKTFTKHRWCQRAAPILCVKRSYCCAATITVNIYGQSDDRPRKPICLVNSTFSFPPPNTRQRLPRANASMRFTEKTQIATVGRKLLLVRSRRLLPSLSCRRATMLRSREFVLGPRVAIRRSCSNTRSAEGAAS
jgi:hypothetical protein